MTEIDSMEIRLIPINAEEYRSVFDLRERVLRQPLGQSLHNDDLSGEVHELTLAALEDGQVQGCVMLRPLPDGELKLRQMAVAPELQGRGVGAQLVTAAEELGRERGFCKMTLHARDTAIGFYERLGYDIEGQQFEEVGIPHHKMFKQL